MIVTRLMGGLGNQMFQYAAGKALALKHDVPLFIDETFLKAPAQGNYTKRNLELQQLNVKIHNADSRILIGFENTGGFWQKLFPGKNTFQVFYEKSRNFDPAFFRTGPNVYLSGYWQCEKYFSGIRELLREEFTPAYDFLILNDALLKRISETISVSLHVRRGDYVSLPSAQAHHGVCGPDYYRKAVEHMRELHGSIKLFIFSDDIEWCRNNLHDLGDAEFVQSQSQRSSNDLFLMSACSHHIIANSSYSWWAAWLGKNRSRTVIAPQQWFKSDKSAAEEIYCEGWIRI